MLFISEDGNRFGLAVGERADVHVRVELVPRVEYRLKDDDVLILQIRAGASSHAPVLAEISGEAGSNTISVMKEDTMNMRPGVYTAVVLLDSPENEYERKLVWPKLKEKDIEHMNPFFPVDNFLLTAGGGEL